MQIYEISSFFRHENLFKVARNEKPQRNKFIDVSLGLLKKVALFAILRGQSWICHPRA